MQSIQLSTFLNQAQFISKQLSQIKKDIQSNATSTQYPDATASNYIERAINLRLAYRNLADGIQANRTLVQVQKEKIEKSKIFLQGLHYYKTTLLEKIKESQIDVINISQYVNKPIQVNNWNQQFDQKEEEIVGELEDKKKKQKLYERLISQKARKEIQIKEKKELYEKVLPAQAKKILDQIQQTSKYFSIQEYSQFDAISNRDLSTVYDKLNSLRSKKIIELNYSKDQFQELEIVICKNEYKYYKQAVANKINVIDNEIKLTISSFAPHFNKLVIGLDRREDFTNEEVFQRLVNNQSIRPIFLEPRNQLERNINAKYVRLDWFDSLFLTGLLTPEALFDLIKERIFCLKLINNIIENIKKLVFFFPLNTQFESPVPNNLKKVSFGSLEKISTETYLQMAYQPEWLQKYISSVQRSGKSMIDQSEDINRCNLLSFLESLNVDEFLKPNMNIYYKGSLTIHQNVLSFILIVPFSYPRHKSMIRIVQWHRKKEEDRKPATLDIPCKFHANIQAKILPDRILEAERAVNNDISCFFKGEEVGNPFRILIQVNRLLTLLGESNDRKY